MFDPESKSLVLAVWLETVNQKKKKEVKEMIATWKTNKREPVKL